MSAFRFAAITVFFSLASMGSATACIVSTEIGMGHTYQDLLRGKGYEVRHLHASDESAILASVQDGEYGFYIIQARGALGDYRQFFLVQRRGTEFVEVATAWEYENPISRSERGRAEWRRLVFNSLPFCTAN